MNQDLRRKKASDERAAKKSAKTEKPKKDLSKLYSELVTLLQERNIENTVIESARKHNNPGILLQALREFFRHHFSEEFQKETLIKIVKHTYPKEYISALTCLQNSQLLTTENMDVLVRRPICCEAVQSLNNLGILNQENFNVLSDPASRIKEKKGLEKVENGLGLNSSLKALNHLQQLLKDSGSENSKSLELLNSIQEKNQIFFDGITKRRDPEATGSLLNTINKHFSLNIVDKFTEKFDKILNLTSIRTTSDVLHQLVLTDPKLLTQENFSRVLDVKAPWSVAPALQLLRKNKDLGLNQENLDIILACDQADLMPILNEAKLILKENISQLLNPESKFLYSNWARTNIWRIFPATLLTQNVLDELITRAQRRQSDQEKQIELNQYVRELLEFHTPEHDAFNDPQNTHVTSVHQSASESAKKLNELYPDFDLNEAIKRLKVIVEGSSNPKKIYAKKCLLRLDEAPCSYIEATSKLSIKRLLGLISESIHDPKHKLDFVEASNRLVEGLIEIQCGYGEDKPICKAGTFNKLIEIRQGYDEVCNIKHITSQIASAKLPRIINEEVLSLLSAFTNPRANTGFLRLTAEGVTSLSVLLNRVEAEDVEFIWDKIKAKVSGRMFEEFGELYESMADIHFISLVESGKDVDLKGIILDNVQKQIQQTSGYHQYCSNILYSHQFFSMSKEEPKNHQSTELKPKV